MIDAMRYINAWYAMAEKHAVQTWRVEDVSAGLVQQVCRRVGHPVTRDAAEKAVRLIGTDENKHPDGPELGWSDLPDCAERDELTDWARRLGYACDDHP